MEAKDFYLGTYFEIYIHSDSALTRASVFQYENFVDQRIEFKHAMDSCSTTKTSMLVGSIGLTINHKVIEIQQ